jgi:hypothetical protein
MLKRIPKSDISIRPFKAYKEWSFSGSAALAEPRIALLEANISSSELSGLYPKNSIYGQLRAQFYNGHEDNPFLRFGNKSNVYNDNLLSKERYLENDAKIISIPQIYVGEGIKRGSFRLIDNGNIIEDDLNGNLLLLGNDTITFELFNLNGDDYTFDLQGTNYTITITTINLETGQLIWYYNGEVYITTIVSFDINSGEMVVTNVEFAAAEDSNEKAGNIFYNSGLITLTRKPNQRLTSNWELSFKSTQTIYEHEYLLIVNEDEFNVSQNPSAVVEIGRETSFITGSDNKIYRVTTNPGVKYIRKKSILENGSIMDYSIGSNREGYEHISGGFDQYEYSSSLDSTGSYLAPFITTIGLYDDNCDLVAVAKLPQPIKSYPDLPVNFIVRFDT